ncbi:outer membrane beta-barrel protein [Myxococcus sp. K15C18031901]|uniref:outer membrane beta-barrel protein n=1 Tax=Myxococcus dinghuensis TaxID=2906761 RepID=UPI0020A6DF54|nr:outer membrane beta-barrel protein [Myxococcus dinghuensis]MCP3098874.1 outer membrane beta-barrel protein [Myxococcus dinghuensis]
MGSAVAGAQEVQTSKQEFSDPTGLELTVGLGFQAGAGYVYKNGERLDNTRGDVKLSDGANGGVPVLVELGYRLSPKWFVGAYGQFSYILTKENPYSCPSGFDCTATQLRFGPHVQYHFSPEASFDPFVGLGFGIAILNVKNSGTIPVPTPAGTLNAGFDLDSQTRGPEFVNVTVGGKWRLGNSLSFGPYLTAGYASYTARSGTTKVSLPAPVNQSTESPLTYADNGPNLAIMLGFRATLNP